MRSLLMSCLVLSLWSASRQVALSQDEVMPVRSVIRFAPTVLPLPGESVSIGDCPVLEVSRIGSDFWISGDGRITTPLPVGYPRPTPPGAIELKAYPSVRRAEVSGRSFPDLMANLGFWKLFRHIKSRDIAMTSPVEMEYVGLNLAEPSESGAWSMAFLYREPSLGPTGTSGDVKVLDSSSTVVLSIAALGDNDVESAVALVPRIRAALAEVPALEASGSIRVLFYNGPDVRSGKRWLEVQIPVRLREAPKTSPR